MKKANLSATMIAATLVLAACSGGGGDSGKSVEGTPGLVGAGDLGANASPPPPGSGYGGGIGTTPPPFVAPPPTAGGAVPASGSSTVGAWSPTVMNWTDGGGKSVLPLHMALLPDGRVMSYGTHDGDGGSFQFLYDIWQPPVGTLNAPDAYSSHMTLPTGISTHLFCSAQILVPTTGQLLINGGDNWEGNANTNTGTTEINLYNPVTNVLSPAGNMHEPRWYGTPITLPNGEMCIQGGTDGRSVFGGGAPIVATHGEVRNPVTGQFRLLTGFNTAAFDNNYPRNFVAPDGKVFGFDHQQMYKIDPFGNGGTGSMQLLYDDQWQHGWTGTSTAVMFRPGKILQVGGLGGWGPDGDGRTPTIIDINGATPVLSNTGKIAHKRNWANSTVLPDGKVVMIGGSEENVLNDQNNWTTGQVGYQVEIYDPVSNTWTLGPAQQRMRLYHSVSMLLPNGTVLSAAGGWPGPQLNRNAEVYYPPYLFKGDGSWAARPTISSAPTVANPMSTLSISSPNAATVGRVTIVKTGSVTHSFNFEQRFIELAFTRTGDTLNAQLPANKFETPPGFYMIFVLDANGVPSESKIVRINPA